MRALKLLLVLLAGLIGLGGIAAALMLRQVPVGHRLTVDGATYDDGLVFAPRWVEVKLSPLHPPPVIEARLPMPADDPTTALEARLDAARAALATAEAGAAERASVTDTDFADAERAHLDALTEQRLAGERRIAALEAEARALPERRAAEAEAEAAAILAPARAAHARAEATRDRLLAEALAGERGRLYIAIEAARRFQLGDTHLPDPPPDFLVQLGGMAAWHRFFLSQP